MLVTHLLSGEQLFLLQDSGGNLVNGATVPLPHMLYTLRRFSVAGGYSLVSLYGMEIQPVVVPQ